MLQTFRTATLLLASLTILTGGLYPLAVTLVGQVVFPRAANGSFIERKIPSASDSDSAQKVANRHDWSKDRTVGTLDLGSELVGQPFARPEFFWGRLSATSPVPYNAAASSGSNFGPLHPTLIETAKSRIAALREFGPTEMKIPVDLVTSSGSGLDPHISPAAAEFQVPRIAAARNLEQVVIRDLVRQHTQSRQLGLLGEPRVNVLRLNLELDRIQSAD